MLRHAYRLIIFPVDTSHPQISFELRITNYELISPTSLNLQSVSLYLLMNARSLLGLLIHFVFILKSTSQAVSFGVE